jgi:hypothetical protein
MNQRPTGVTILAILAFIGGVLSILAGLALVGLGGVFAAAGGGLAILFGIYALVWGALALWIGWGFWQLRPSAWRWGVILMVVGVVIAVLQIILGYSDFVGGIISIAIDLAVIYYLTTPAVRAAFGQPTGGSMTDAVMMAFGMGGAGAAAASGGGTDTGTSTPPPAESTPPAAERPAMTPPAEPPAMTPPTESSWGTSTETPPGGEAEREDENRA